TDNREDPINENTGITDVEKPENEIMPEFNAEAEENPDDIATYTLTKFDINTVADTVYLSVYYHNTIYLPIHSIEADVDIRYIEDDYEGENFRIEITDSDDKVCYINKWDGSEEPDFREHSPRYYDDMDKSVTGEYTLSAHLYMTNEVEADAEYTLMVYDYSDNELLPAPREVRFTDKPIIKSVSQFSYSPILPGNDSFQIGISAINLRNKDDLTLQLLDKNNAVVAKSGESFYTNYFQEDRLSNISYIMDVDAEASLEKDKEYMINVVSNGTDIINTAEVLYLYPSDKPVIIEIDTSQKTDGKIIAKTVNIAAGQEITGEIYKDFGDRGVVFTGTATCDSKGQFVFDFLFNKEEHNEGYYRLEISQGSKTLDSTRFYIAYPDDKVKASLSYPRVISDKAEDFDFYINISNLRMDKSKIAVELLSDKNGVIGGHVNGTIETYERTTFETYGDYFEKRETAILGTIMVDNGVSLEAGTYSIRLKYDGKEVPLDEGSKNIRVVDKPMILSYSPMEEQSVYGFFGSGLTDKKMVSAAVYEMTVDLYDIYNVADNTKFKIEIHDSEIPTADTKKAGGKNMSLDGTELYKMGKVKFDLESLSDGDYYIFGFYDEQLIEEPYKFTVSSAVYYGWLGMNTYVTPEYGKIYLGMYDSLNMDAKKTRVEAVNLLDNKRQLSIEDNWTELDGGALHMSCKNTLPESYYMINVYYNDVKISGDDDNELYATYTPMIIDNKVISLDVVNNQDIEIQTLNYDRNTSYKLEFYKYEGKKGSLGAYKDTINVGKIDANGNLVISPSLVEELPVGSYNVLIFKDDDTIIGKTSMQRKVTSAKSTKPDDDDDDDRGSSSGKSSSGRSGSGSSSSTVK
ncbi:MAG: hypothetical protein GX154_02795, partial [Clostridiales bacterium]|nr:hypothetical protein [Clostridiales bacterium]